jgi:adenine-specific DNA methylase
MSRAIVFGTLLPDPGDQRRPSTLALIAEASEFEASNHASRINPLRELLAQSYPEGPPRVLDCFAGGGAIPLEALRLGCDTTALELNPVAYLIDKACLEYPQLYGQPDELGRNKLADDFVDWAGWIRKHVAKDLAAVFPGHENGRRPAVYFWCRTMRCPDPGCGREIPLVKDWWLDNNPRRLAWVDLQLTDAGSVELAVRTGEPDAGKDPSRGTVKASSATCPSCGTTTPASDVREWGKRSGFGRRLYAVLVVDGDKRYRAPTIEELTAAEDVAVQLIADLHETADGSTGVPDERCDPNGFRRVQNLVFGIDTFASMFNPRQLYVLGRLAQGVREAHAHMMQSGVDESRARAIATYLAFCVDRIADRNSSFCTWGLNPRGFAASVRNTFPQQAIRMTWNFVEIDPFQKGSGNWDGAVRWIEAAIRHCSTTTATPATVLRGNAQSLPFDDESFDAVVVDPPYYDAIQYSYLSDFFYVWLKRSAGSLYPGVFATDATPKTQEVIQNQAKRSSPDFVSSEEFDRRLSSALREMARVLKSDGVMSLVFAHTDVMAWEKLLKALRSVGLIVSTSWPMRSEMANRSTASIQHAVLGSSVVLVCRKHDTQDEGFYDDVVRELEARIAERLDRFEDMGLVGADYFVSAVGPAFEVFAKYAKVIRLSGDEVTISDLMILARQVVARHAMGKLLGDESVSALDPVSLMYLTWRWAYNGESIPADEAYKLERALDVDLSALVGHDGVAEKSGSSFALKGPEDRKGLKLGTSPLMIDVLHHACNLWDSGRRKELEQALADTGMGASTAFWSLARALAEVLPEGNRERTMLLGLTGNMDALSEAAAKAATPRFEQQALNWDGSAQPKMFTDGTEQPRLGQEQS